MFLPDKSIFIQITITKMRSTLIIFFISASCYFSFAQKKEQLTIIGQVSDTDNIPLTNASIVNNDANEGTTTDKNGFFILTLSKQTTVIKISYVGYYTLQKKITSSDIEQSKNDTILLPVLLKPKLIELPEVGVQSSNIYKVFNQPNTNVIDYSFHQHGIMLLLLKEKKYKLELVDESGNTLYETPISKKANSLVKDCFGNLHVLCKNNIYQINDSNAQLSLMKGFSIEKFDEYLKPCVANFSETLFLKDYGLHNQSVIYYLIEKESKKERLVKKIIDEKSMIAVNDHYWQTMTNARTAPSVMAENDFEQQRFARKVEREQWFYQLVLNRPVYNPLFKIKDSIFIFNHIEDIAYVYSQQGEQQRSFPIKYHYKTGWKNEILIDYATNKIYAKYMKGGLVYLSQIDHNNGEILNEFKLENHVFPCKLKIQDGYAYYLFNTKKDFKLQNLYKQQLK